MNVLENVIGIGLSAWLFIFLGTTWVIIYNWRRRHLYYHASKIPGPYFSLPLIGSVSVLNGLRKNSFKEVMKIVTINPPVFKAWVGPTLYVSTSRPEDLEIILNTSLERSSFYKLLNEHTTNSLLTSPVSIWKKRRQTMNHSFNPKVVNSFVEIFHQNGKKLVEIFGEGCGKEESDLMSKIWRCTLNIAHETIVDVDPKFHSEAQKSLFCRNADRLEKITLKRFSNIYLHLNALWKRSALRKEVNHVSSMLYGDVSQIIDHKLDETQDYNELKSKRFLNYLLHPKNKEMMERNDLESEVFVMCTAASETTAITITTAMVLLGIYQDIQEKLFREISTVLPNDSAGVTLVHLQQMEYLDFFMKETLRMFPPAPFIIRYIDKDVQSGPYVFPTGSNLLIPILHIHTNPDLWPNPLKFDPDRFLPENMAKVHRCAYIPFSFGPRNCIGRKYAMISMKVMLVEVVRNYKIKTLKHKSWEEIEVDYNMFAKFKNYAVVLEKRDVF